MSLMSLQELQWNPERDEKILLGKAGGKTGHRFHVPPSQVCGFTCKCKKPNVSIENTTMPPTDFIVLIKFFTLHMKSNHEKHFIFNIKSKF